MRRPIPGNGNGDFENRRLQTGNTAFETRRAQTGSSDREKPMHRVQIMNQPELKRETSNLSKGTKVSIV